jgi:MSHA biogenesis protein MshI
MTGIALGRDGFALVHVVREAGREPRLDVCEFHPCSSPVDLPRAMSVALKATRLERTNCVCLPELGSYGLRQIDAPPVEESEIREASRWAIKDLIDFGVDSAVIDVFSIPEPEPEARAKRLYVVAAPNAAVQACIDLIKGVGLNLIAIDIVELALRNLSALLPEDEQGVALMYLVSEVGLLTITRGGSLYLARTIETDLEVLTATTGFSAGDTKPDDPREGQYVLDALLLEAQRSLDYFEHQLSQRPVSAVFIGPTHVPVPALNRHLNKNLNYDVVELDLNSMMECKEPVPESLQARCLAAVGAALRAEH